MAKSELETRVCKTCEVEKPIQDFPFTGGGYRRRVCAECYRASRRTSWHIPRYVRALREKQSNPPREHSRDKARAMTDSELYREYMKHKSKGRLPPAYIMDEVTRRTRPA